MDENKTPENAIKFECKICDFNCSKQSDWIRHISRPKHQNNENGINKAPKNADFLCNCGKVYKHSTGLWRHKKTCDYKIVPNQPIISDMKTNLQKVLGNNFDIIAKNIPTKNILNNITQLMYNRVVNSILSNNNFKNNVLILIEESFYMSSYLFINYL